MDATTLERLRAKLEARRDELKAELAQLDQELQWLAVDQDDERGGLGNHMSDDGSSLMEQERVATVRADLEALLKEVEAALTRMDEGTYGICQRCHCPIPEERLEAIPHVQFCVECQSHLERHHALYGAAEQVS